MSNQEKLEQQVHALSQEMKELRQSLTQFMQESRELQLLSNNEPNQPRLRHPDAGLRRDVSFFQSMGAEAEGLTRRLHTMETPAMSMSMAGADFLDPRSASELPRRSPRRPLSLRQSSRITRGPLADPLLPQPSVVDFMCSTANDSTAEHLLVPPSTKSQHRRSGRQDSAFNEPLEFDQEPLLRIGPEAYGTNVSTPPSLSVQPASPLLPEGPAFSRGSSFVSTLPEHHRDAEVTRMMTAALGTPKMRSVREQIRSQPPFLNEEEHWLAAKLNPFVWQPDSWQENVLDAIFVITTAMSCAAAVFPVHYYTENGHDTSKYVPGMGEGLFICSVVWSCFAQLLTVVWFLGRFLCPTPHPDDPFIIETSVQRIAHIYVKRRTRWFAYDLIYVVPLEWFFIGWNWKVFFTLQFRNFPRIFRFYTLGYSSNPLQPQRPWMRLLCLGAFWALTIHLLASVFWSIQGGLTYVDAIYWTFTTLSTVGYGDIVPLGESNRLFACFTMIVSMAMVSLFTAYATKVMTQKDKRRDREMDLKQHLNSMIQYYNLPWGDKRTLLEFYPTLLDLDNEEQFRALVSGLPQKERDRILSYVNAKALRRFEVFSQFDDSEALLALAGCLDRRVLAAGETIIEAGEPGNEMCFLSRGFAEIVRFGAKPGDDVRMPCPKIFGEIALLQNCTRSASVITTCPSEVLMLKREDFERVVRPHEELFGVIRGIAESRLKENRHIATMTAAEFLKAESVLGTVDDEQSVVELAKRLTPLMVAANDTVVKQGEIGKALFFVVSGSCEAVVEEGIPTPISESPGEIIATFNRGEMFGEMEIVENVPSRCTVVASMDTELLRLSKEDFAELISTREDLIDLVRWVGKLRKHRPEVAT